jgi:branched-chain amino acid transport system substrate-binding protein
LGVGGAASSALSACTRGDAQPSPADLPELKIGLVVPQSGVYKLTGDDLANGFKLYLQLNPTLGGRRINLIVRDEGDTADSGRAAVERLIKQDQVIALAGIASSATMDAVKDLVEGSQIPLIGSNASPTTLQGVRYIWRTSYIDDEPAKALGRYLAGKHNGSDAVAIVAPDYQAGHDGVEGFVEAYGKHIAGDPIFVPFNPPATNFQSALTGIRGSDATAVFCCFAGAQATAFVKQYREVGIGVDLYAPGFLTEGGLLREQGDAAKGIFTSMNYSPDLDNQANRTFASAYLKKYNVVPTAYAMASYDAAFVLDKAIELAGTQVTPQTLNLSIGKIGSIDSPRGNWQFNQNRTPLQKWYLRQVRPDGGVLSNVVLSELTTLG